MADIAEGADVKKAYLFWKLDIHILMGRPTNYTGVLVHIDTAFLLEMWLYGARQAVGEREVVMNQDLLKCGFIVSQYDHRS